MRVILSMLDYRGMPVEGDNNRAAAIASNIERLLNDRLDALSRLGVARISAYPDDIHTMNPVTDSANSR